MVLNLTIQQPDCVKYKQANNEILKGLFLHMQTKHELSEGPKSLTKYPQILVHICLVTAFFTV